MPGGPPGTPAGCELCLLLLWSVLAVLCFFCSFRSFPMTFCMSFVSLVTPSSSAFSLSLSSPLFFFTLRSFEFNDFFVLPEFCYRLVVVLHLCSDVLLV